MNATEKNYAIQTDKGFYARQGNVAWFQDKPNGWGLFSSQKHAEIYVGEIEGGKIVPVVNGEVVETGFYQVTITVKASKVYIVTLTLASDSMEGAQEEAIDFLEASGIIHDTVTGIVRLGTPDNN